MKKNHFIWLAAILIVGAVAASTLAYLWLGVDWDVNRNDSMLLAETIDHVVLDELSQPLTVAKMLSGEAELKEMLHNEWKYTEEEMEDRMKEYLGSIQKRFGYDTVYLVSEKSKRYYTHLGLNKVIDPQTDSYDIWFSDFVEDGDPFRVETSKDQVNRDQFTIFIYSRLESEIGRFLGVAGVGVEAGKILEELKSYEEKYGIRVDFVTRDGLIQLSNRTETVRSARISDVTFPDVTDEEYHYEVTGIGGYSVIKYLPELGWYMVIRNNTEENGTGYDFRFFFAEAAILIVALALLSFLGKAFRIETVVNSHNDPNIDELTGLPNREYFIQIYGEKGTIRTIQFQSIAEFSIDDFEQIGDGAKADKLVLSVLRTAREVFGRGGQIMRWNKSSFVVLLELPEEEADVVCRQFVRDVEEMGEVTVSMGLTRIDLNSTLKRDYYRAVQLLYLVKELGGNNVKRG